MKKNKHRDCILKRDGLCSLTAANSEVEDMLQKSDTETESVISPKPKLKKPPPRVNANLNLSTLYADNEINYNKFVIVSTYFFFNFNITF